MNEITLPGPCADYEFEIVELLDGALAPERARTVCLHVESCVRCRAWQTEFSAMHERLRRKLPRPELSADFDRRLQERIATLAGPAGRVAVDREYREMLRSLRRGARWSLATSAVAAAVIACGFAALHGLLAHSALPVLVLGEHDRLMASVAFSAACAIAALAWSAGRGLPMPRLRG